MDSLSYRKARQDQEQPMEEPVVTHHTPASIPTTSLRKDTHRMAKTEARGWGGMKLGLIALIIAGLVALYLLLQAFGVVGGGRASAPLIDGGKYQAVFLTNGQVYFGKLSQVNADYVKITEIFYLQKKQSTDSKENPQNAASQNASDVELIKLGNEVHGPEDAMVVPREQVLFYENLKQDGNVVKTISQYQSQKK
jgi:hypothetical protein